MRPITIQAAGLPFTAKVRRFRYLEKCSTMVYGSLIERGTRDRDAPERSMSGATTTMSASGYKLQSKSASKDKPILSYPSSLEINSFTIVDLQSSINLILFRAIREQRQVMSVRESIFETTVMRG